jgi:hypothetical protein
MLGDTFFGASSATTNILTLQSTTRNQIKVTNGSTFEIWRSAGVESARFDSNGNFALGTTSASSRLHVRGDGTNPIARFESLAGTRGFFIKSDGLGFEPIGSSGQEQIVAGYSGGFVLSGSVLGINANTYDGQSSVAATLASSYGGGWRMLHPSYAMTSGNLKTFHVVGGIAAAIGSANYRPIQVEYTINNSGVQTGNATGLFLNATETALNGMTHNLMDLQVGGSSKFKVDNLGNIFALTGGIYSAGLTLSQYVILTGVASGVLRLTNQLGTDFSRLQLGGTTNLFPAIKRNGAAIDFRLADDSAMCNISAATFYGIGTFTALASNNINIGNVNYNSQMLFISGTNTTTVLALKNDQVVIGGGASILSAILQANSTTQGFLMPRMTTAQINAILLPANGLQVYNTTISHTCCYQGGAWVKFNHSPM